MLKVKIVTWKFCGLYVFDSDDKHSNHLSGIQHNLKYDDYSNDSEDEDYSDSYRYLGGLHNI